MDKIKIIADSLAPEKEWQEACDQCHHATYFHTPEWAHIFSAYLQGQMQPWPRKIVFKDGKIAIIPLSRISYFHGLFNQYVSSPAGTFGGWLSLQELSPGHLRELVLYMQKHPNITWRENPYDTGLRDIEIKAARHDFTQAVDLCKGYDDIIRTTSRTHQKSVRRALRSGVSVREADSREQWQRHFQGYLASRSRWEKGGGHKLTKGYSWGLFEILFNARSSHCKLWLALCKGEIASSVVSFYWNRHAVAWHGGAFEEYFDVYPNHLLYQEMVRDAHEKGFHWFDFNTTGDLSGVASFKDQLGTQRISSRVLDKSSLSKKIARTAKSIFFR
jgi:hypothetical protein